MISFYLQNKVLKKYMISQKKKTVLMALFQILVMKNDSVTALSSIVLNPNVGKIFNFSITFHK